jgi:hypothetical protein
MAALALNKDVRFVWGDGIAERTNLYSLNGVTTADTIDLSPDFKYVKRAVLLGTTVLGALAAANAGNVITIPAGVAQDAGWLLVFGVMA